jgi:hypothetical protein
MTSPGPRSETLRDAPDIVGSSPGSRRLLAEVAVVVGAACIALHLLTAFGHHSDDVVLTAVMVVMAAACAPCLRALWAGPTRRTWKVTGGMYAAMATAHLVWPGLQPTAGTHHHEPAGPSWSELGMWVALGLAGVQLALTALALTVRNDPVRRRPDPWQSDREMRAGEEKEQK